jgi:NAD dependent epimerase/dehydratase
MKVLVTGADGFIGSHLVERLVDAGISVKALVYYNSFSSWGWLDTVDKSVMREVEVTVGDIRDASYVDRITADCTHILHLAALIGIPYSYQAAESYVQTNVLGTLNILEAARKHSVSQVICTSTSETYGSAQYVPIDESHPLVAQSPYAATKISADHLAMSYFRSFGLPVTIIRPFNTFGPRQSARAVIPTIITQLAAGVKNLQLGSVEPTRDFTYVSDTVQAFYLAVKGHLGIGEIINLGTGYEISISSLAQIISSVMDVEVDVSMDLERKRPSASEVERLLADNSKAKRVLDWSPKYQGGAGLTEALSATVDWYLIPENRVKFKAQAYNI